MALTSAVNEKLLAALLSVNGYPVDRALGLMPALKQAGLLVPAQVAELSQEAMIAAMKAAGYDRGGYLPILSYRVFKLMEAAADGRLDGLQGQAAAGDKAGFAATLAAVHGFGPSTVDVAWALCTQ